MHSTFHPSSESLKDVLEFRIKSHPSLFLLLLVQFPNNDVIPIIFASFAVAVKLALAAKVGGVPIKHV